MIADHSLEATGAKLVNALLKFFRSAVEIALKSTYVFSLEASHTVFIGSAPRLAEGVVRSCRLPSRHAREKNALLAPNHAQRLGAFFMGC